NLRRIEELVAQHDKGDRPSDPPSATPRPQALRFEVTPATYALLRQAQQALADERGAMLDDEALLSTLCTATLEYLAGPASEGHARHQILTIVCERCKQGFQDGGGRRIPISDADRDVAECDAQRLGSELAPLPRATQDVTPAKRRAVFAR